MRKILCLLYGNLERIELEKDVILVPYYLAKELRLEAEILCSPADDTVKTNKIKINRRKIKTRLGKLVTHLSFIAVNARRVQVLMLFHATRTSFINAMVFKLFNPCGKVYLKLDSDSGKEFTITSKATALQYKFFMHFIDVVSCETQAAYNSIIETTIYKNTLLSNKLVLMPNGFDEEDRINNKVKVRRFQDKENLIITVGRLGSYPKNTQMFLKALKNIDLKNWKVKLIGPIDPLKREELEHLRDECFSKENISFVGSIYDKRELMDYYNRSKVFVFTSEWESYGLVLNEARRFHNYILSTDVGAAEDIIAKKYGQLLEQNNHLQLEKFLISVVNGQTDINVYDDSDDSCLFYETVIKIVADRIK